MAKPAAAKPAAAKPAWLNQWHDKASEVYEASDGSSALVSFVVHVAPLGRYYYCATEKGLLKLTRFSCSHSAEDIQYNPTNRTWTGTINNGRDQWVIFVERETIEINRPQK